MKVTSLAAIAALGSPLLIGGTADAAYTGLTTDVQNVNITGFGDAHVIRVYASFDNSADTLVNVLGTAPFPLTFATNDGSAFYQNPMAGDSGIFQAPGTIALFPEIAYDSYLDIGMTMSTQGAPVFMTPGFPPVGWGADGTLSATNGSWTRFPGDPLSVAGVDGKVFLAQITIAQGSELSGTLNLTTGAGPQFGQTFNVPAPGALALLGVAGLVGGRRRRRV